MVRLIFSVLISLCLSLPLFGQKTVTIFHFNDTHSYIFPWGPKINGIPQNGGATRLIKRYNDLRATAVNPILLHGGDSFTGGMAFNRFLGRAEFQLFDSMGVSAMALGNHEFDLKPLRLKNAIAQSNARFDFLSANIQYNNDPSGLQQHVKPFVIKNIGNVRVGIFGLTTTSTVFYGESAPITFENAVPAARRMVDSLRNRNVDLIIALSHLGVSEDRQLAKSVGGIHVIVGGHSHTPLNKPIIEQNATGDTTLIVQAGAKWEYLGMLTLTVNNNKLAWSYRLDRIDARLPEDPQFASIVRAYRDSIIATYGNIFSDTVGMLEEDFPPINPFAGDLELPLLGLVTDAYRSTAKADIALEAASLMRQNLYKGSISTSEVRDMLSWAYDAKQGLGKRLSVLTLTGSTLPLVLTATVSLNFDAFTEESTSLLALHPSGIRYTIKREGGFTTFENIWVGDNPLDEKKVYTLVVNEFVADLTKRYPFLQFLSRTDLPIGPAEAFIQYMGNLSRVNLSDISLGRVWNHSSIVPMTITLDGNALSLKWSSSAAATSYNMYRKRSGSLSSFTKINTSPIVKTEFRDDGISPKSSYVYMLEEVRSNRLHYAYPPIRFRSSEAPASSQITGNYPNPFSARDGSAFGGNPSTTIEYSITESGRVTVKIYNLLGQLVNTLIDQEQDDGEYSIVWSGRDMKNQLVPSGVYVVSLSTVHHHAAHKILVIR